MGLLNRTNKPLRITGRGAGSPVVSALRPVHVEKAAPCMAACACGSSVRDWITTIALRERPGSPTKRPWRRPGASSWLPTPSPP